MLPSEALSRELRELSGWEEEYTLGYLLRKLPWSSWVGWNADIYKGEPSQFIARYNKDMSKDEVWEAIADTPEDAACKLAIELFKRGILTKGTN